MKQLLLSLALLAGVACSSDPALHQKETVSMPDLNVPGLQSPRPDLLTGGQPEAGAWAGLAAHGVTTVINLRPKAEMAGRDEAAEVAAAGMRYAEIPVAGAAGITLENARALRALLEGANGPVLVHCASGNRVGALIALGAADAGVDTEQAIAQGRAAGLTGAEARVRELLAAPAARGD